MGPDVGFDQSEEACQQLDAEDWQVLQEFPVTASTIAAATDQDEELRAVRNFVKNGWPQRHLRSNSFWFNKQDRLSVKAGVLLLNSERGARVVIPRALRKQVLDLLHEGHWGVVNTKQLARRHCYWPGIDKDVQDLVRKCSACQVNQATPKQDLQSWPQPSEPWERVHVDFAGPFWGKMWLIVVDALSNFPYIVEMGTTTAANTIDVLEKIFVTEGLPQVLVSDNGPQFTSSDFFQFCKMNGISHVCAPPFHPQSNGEVERCVRTFKTAMGKARAANTPRARALLRVLATYRTLPGKDGRSPAEILHGRQPRTLLSLLAPGDRCHSGDAEPKFKVGDRIYCKSFRGELAWWPGIITATKGSRLYEIKTEHRSVVRHQGQIRMRYTIEKVDKQELHSREESRKKSMQQLIEMERFQEHDHWAQQPAQEQHQEERHQQHNSAGGAAAPRVDDSGAQAVRRVRRRVRFAPYATQSRGEGVAYVSARLNYAPNAPRKWREAEASGASRHDQRRRADTGKRPSEPRWGGRVYDQPQ